MSGELVGPIERTIVICPAVYEGSRCHCQLEANHAPPHHCECGGEWMDDGKIVNFPGGPGSDGDFIARLFGWRG